MTILDFQEQITAANFRKGMDYYRKNKVTDLGIAGNEWSAYVQGTEQYVVYVTVEGKHIAHTSCNCRAFNYEDHCKHVVAVLCAINEGLFNSPVKDSTVTSYTISLLNSLSAEDLRRFVLDQMHLDSLLANELTEFAESTRDSEAVIKHIEPINRSFINAANVEDHDRREIGWLAAKPAKKLLDQAREKYGTENNTVAIDILFAVISKKPAFDASNDDEAGAYERIVEEALVLLDEIYAEAELDEYNSRRLSRRAWEFLYSELYNIDSYSVHWLELMIRHGNVEEMKDDLLELIDELLEEAKKDQYTSAHRRLEAAKKVVKDDLARPIRKPAVSTGIAASPEQSLRRLQIPTPKIQPSKGEKQPAAISEKKAAYLLEKQSLLTQLQEEKKAGTIEKQEALQKALIMLMQKNSDVFGIREMAPGFFEETGHTFFYEALKDTYMTSEWHELLAKEKKSQAIIRKMNR